MTGVLQAEGAGPTGTPTIATESGDDQLVVRSRRGDRAAFEQLVRQCARVVYSRHYLDTRDRHRAEDLTQETFLLAWRSIGQLEDAAGFRAWLLSIARSV